MTNGWRILILITVISAACLFFFLQQDNELTIVNNSNTTMESGNVRITNWPYKFGQLNPGETKTIRFAILFGEPRIVAELSLSSGKLLKSNDAYLCRGMKNHITLLIGVDGTLKTDRTN